MEDRSRNFAPVQIGMVSVEAAEGRYPKKLDKQSPAIAYWRINLTALSQRHNLYFIAVRDKVEVYRPRFPYQTLGDVPCLTIIPHLAEPAAHGYIDPRRPHTINHLIVGDLGNQEILLLSTDSGNVVAYYTGSIDVAIDKRPYQFSIDGNADLVGVRPFLSQWVYESAWGLAIHKEGRMIAVSANTPHHRPDYDSSSKITVFAFALTSSDSHSTNMINVAEDPETTVDPGEWSQWSPSDSEPKQNLPNRDRNYQIVLGGQDGHQHNVPCIAFVNSPEDRPGSWLLSTDIRGQVKLWQIWQGRSSNNWDFNHRGELATPWTHHRESGWLVAALDVNAFRPAESMEKFIGNHRAPQYHGYHSSGDSYDLTNTVRRYTPQNNPDHPFIAYSDDESSEEEQDELNCEALDEDAEQNTTSVSTSRHASNRLNQLPATVSSETRINESREQAQYRIPIDEADDEDSDLFEEDIEDRIDCGTDEDSWDNEHDGISAGFGTEDRSSQSLESVASSLSQGADDHAPGLSQDPDVRQGQGDLLAVTMPSIDEIFGKKLPPPLQQPQVTKFARLPQIPFIHCSNLNVRLFDGPTAQYPHVFCARMLRQNLPPELEEANFAHFDRLCMVHQIPELGIILIATQLGRCAVCSLTKRSRDGLLGFRVDWILPTKKQERRGDRPANCVLIGLAASPIQGHEPLDTHNTSGAGHGCNWARNRVIDGMRTTFDPRVVLLGTPPQTSEHERDTDRTESEQTSIRYQTRRWVRPEPSDHWAAYESSRRYKVMLTYSDLSVLTYELSRGVEREDVAMQSTLDSLD